MSDGLFTKTRGCKFFRKRCLEYEGSNEIPSEIMMLFNKKLIYKYLGLEDINSSSKSQHKFVVDSMIQINREEEATLYKEYMRITNKTKLKKQARNNLKAKELSREIILEEENMYETERAEKMKQEEIIRVERITQEVANKNYTSDNKGDSEDERSSIEMSHRLDNRDSDVEDNIKMIELQPYVINNIIENLTDDEIVTSREEIKKGRKAEKPRKKRQTKKEKEMLSLYHGNKQIENIEMESPTKRAKQDEKYVTPDRI
ncbi:MAG: hypothetical protein HRT42_06835 [Campylobacteraceae bacterium]|nr:hypothetical protein [Campylobacteraceae bacterium]